MITIFGIRHHGPGSARSLLAALVALRPELILIEGPPEADGVISLAAHPDMKPPVALLLYQPDRTQDSLVYPFAEFSPEWQAIQYGLKSTIPLQFIDLPQVNRVGEENGPDPFAMIAEAAGYPDGERWWEHFVEQRRESGKVFHGVIELMSNLRAEAEKTSTGVSELDLKREACMRSHLRNALAQGYQNIAVVCGAWHAPALVQPDAYPNDASLLKGFSQTGLIATWIPWTYDRLSRRNGYGAGIEAPGWYDHLWQTNANLVEKWMVRVAQLLRAEDIGISPAHAIEATRLAETLAALRERPVAGLSELNEAVQAVFCFGDDTPMRLIDEKLIIGQRMGKIPDTAPSVPIQRDLAAIQKRIRFEPSASPELIDLDLRKPLLLERSQLLHRLNLLGIPWGRIQQTRGAKGTFHELWQIEWKPEFAVAVIEAGLWGNTVFTAASNKVETDAEKTQELPALTTLVESALLANLEDTIPKLMQRLQHVAATCADIPHLIRAMPPLANILRYGNVRKTDTGMVNHVVDEFVTRICIGLPTACTSLDDAAAQDMFGLINAMQNAVQILQEAAYEQAWAGAMEHLAIQDNIHGLVRGKACRLLFERTEMSDLIATRMSLALSPGSSPAQAAAWVEGFLSGSGQALIHQPRLWKLVDAWVLSLPEAMFSSLLPILRRTFSTFPLPERRQIGEMAKHSGQPEYSYREMQLDMSRAEKAIALVLKILNNE